MKVFRVYCDPHRFQQIVPVAKKKNTIKKMVFDGESIAGVLEDVDWHFVGKTKEKGDFYSFENGSCLVFNESVYESDLLSILEMSGEIFPINVEGQILYLLNILAYVNMLLSKKTQWNYNQDRSRKSIRRYVFGAHRVDEFSVFKIPETSSFEVLAYSGVKDPEDEFKWLYERLGFTGLVFEELWKDS